MMIIWLILQRLSWKIVMGRLVINMSGFNSSFYWMSLTTFLHTSTTVKNFITNTWSPMRWMRCLDNCKICLRKKIVFWGKKILKDANIYPGNGFLLYESATLRVGRVDFLCQYFQRLLSSELCARFWDPFQHRGPIQSVCVTDCFLIL